MKTDLSISEKEKRQGNQHKTSSSVVKFHDNGENEAIARSEKDDWKLL